ncbi:MAG: rhamnulokinase [Acidobacteriota bacterium]|nr:rhamnulokinase [Acidobacteriota bacterium]
MSIARNVVAVDLGAESGRLVLCRWNGSDGSLEEIHRFPNGPKQVDKHLVWDVDRLWNEIQQGLSKAATKTGGQVDSVGVDGWGVVYALLDGAGNRIGQSFCYRDARNVPAMEKTFTKISRQRLYEITGIQMLPFNTVHQLVAHVEEFPEDWNRAAFWLNLPEYFQYRLTGVAAAEYTEASTTQLLDVRKRTWSQELASALGFDLAKFPSIVQAGTVLGKIRPEISQATGLTNTQVITPACHDTGSAVAGIPFSHEESAFISSGTWSLVGTVLLHPVVSGDGQGKTFTNEGGVAGSIRFLQNVIGLWLLQECLREWNAQGLHLTPADLAAQCLETPPDGPYFYADETRYLAPGNMVERINAGLRDAGFAEEKRPPELAAIIFRSLARRYAEVVGEMGKLTGKSIKRICIVGGGVKNEALNRLTELVTGIPVVRGPSESTAAGNLAVQIAALEKSVSLNHVQEISARLKFGPPQ